MILELLAPEVAFLRRENARLAQDNHDLREQLRVIHEWGTRHFHELPPRIAMPEIEQWTPVRLEPIEHPSFAGVQWYVRESRMVPVAAAPAGAPEGKP